MSFRVKTTHKLLETNPPPQPQKQALSFLDQEDSKQSSYLSTLLQCKTQTNSTPENRPKDTSANGMAIRIISSAQADHM